jgi:hypothetical protein
MDIGLARYLAERAARYEFDAAHARARGDTTHADALERIALAYKAGAREALQEQETEASSPGPTAATNCGAILD